MVRAGGESPACLRVERAGAQDLLVTEASRGGLRFGLSEGGPWDLPAYRGAVARLESALGSDVEVQDCRTGAIAPTCLELTVSGPVLAVETAETEGSGPGATVGWAVVTGGFHAEAGGVTVPPGKVFPLRAGERIVCRRDRGVRGYLGVAGGLAIAPVLGSSGADLPAGLPGVLGRPLRNGDRLLLPPRTRRGDVGGVPGGPTANLPPEWGISLPMMCPGPDGLEAACLRVLPGPHLPRLPRELRRVLLAQVWTVTPQANRVGLRLTGERLPLDEGLLGSLPSEPTVLGTVQLPPDGLPLILGPDRGSLGGYLKVLTVAGGDVFRLAQVRPGMRIRFVPALRSWAGRDRTRVLAEAKVAVSAG